jgi:radical SAM protein with 4Fe4S-binding SPASM domain
MNTPPAPRAIQLEVTGACNLRCRMCLVRYRPPKNRLTASLEFQTFRRIVDALPDLAELTLQGLGEPLMAPDLFAMIAYARERGIRVGFNTNATLLTRATAMRLVDLDLSWLCVSIDGATAATYEGIRDRAVFRAVDRNVRGLTEHMRDRHRSRPELELVFVAMRRNVQEVPAVVRLAADWGIFAVRVQTLSHSFSDAAGDAGYAAIRAFTLSEALWEPDDAGGEARLLDDVAGPFADARQVAADLGITLRLPEGRSAVAARAPGEPGCDWPWRSAYVRHDGGVQPCCMLMGDDRAVLGDITHEPLDAVWRGPKYQAFRTALTSDRAPDVCRGCSMYRRVW